MVDSLSSVADHDPNRESCSRKLRGEKAGLMHDLLTGRVPVAVDSAPEPKEVAANV